MREETMKVMRRYKIFTSHFGDPLAVIPRTEMERLCEDVVTLESENADLKRQVTEAISYILSNEGASMIDCRTCFFVSSCEREPKQCEPNYEMCLRAVRKYIEDTGNE